MLSVVYIYVYSGVRLLASKFSVKFDLLLRDTMGHFHKQTMRYYKKMIEAFLDFEATNACISIENITYVLLSF